MMFQQQKEEQTRRRLTGSMPLLMVSVVVAVLLLGASATSAFPSSAVASTNNISRGGALFAKKTAAPVVAVDGPKKVAVAGATGRTGRLVVEELLKRDGVEEVVALVRNKEKANEMFSIYESLSSPQLTIKTCDFGNQQELVKAVAGCDAALWCATGFSDSPENDIFAKLKQIFTQAVTPKQSIDSVGIPALAQAMKGDGDLPKLVMLSSAGVTRPSWSKEKKAEFEGCADIPIVRLNPFGILDVKKASEETLRQTGTPYCIVRPCGLNDDQPVNSRPIFSQGDVAVGRIHRADVAKVMVDTLYESEACGKTFEFFTLRGSPSAPYPPAPSITPALKGLQLDSIPLSDAQVSSSFNLLQQLLPGETQDAAALAMGQTYEQLDSKTTGRFGERGTENLDVVPLKPSS